MPRLSPRPEPLLFHRASKVPLHRKTRPKNGSIDEVSPGLIPMRNSTQLESAGELGHQRLRGVNTQGGTMGVLDTCRDSGLGSVDSEG